MTGAGNYIPLAASRKLVPLLPRRRQRFAAAASWDEAASASLGYASVPVPPVNSDRDRHATAGPRDIQVVAAFGSALVSIGAPRTMRVVDFGGFDGSFRHVVARAFPDIHLDWTVVELPHVVAGMKPREKDGLRFTDSMDEALDVAPDIVFASASINYVPEPRITVKRLTHAARALILMRLPLWPIASDSPAVQRVQRRPTPISYPTWFFSEEGFMSQIRESGEVLLDFDIPEDRAYFANHYGTYRGIALRCSARP